MSCETEVMREYRFCCPGGPSVVYTPFDGGLRVEAAGHTYEHAPAMPAVVRFRRNGETVELPFTAAKKVLVSRYVAGIGRGVRAEYRDFYFEGDKLGFAIDTLIWLEDTQGDLHAELEVRGDQPGEIRSIIWPAAFAFGAAEGDGYTVLPKMQGALIPARYAKDVPLFNEGMMMTRDAYMPWYGQIRQGAGYMTILETYSDAAYEWSHTPGGDTLLAPKWLPCLGMGAYRRRVVFTFFGQADYNDLCKRYRRYVIEHGRLVTLREKMLRNPRVEGLIGTPIFHTDGYKRLDETCSFYDHEHPEKNETVVPFAETEKRLQRFKERGVERLYMHLDGWGHAGYDSEHPDIFPPAEVCGGVEGMRHLADTCIGLGYLFGVHDQYRDYYHNARTYNDDQAVMDEDGNIEGHAIWCGGPQSILCQQLAPYYVRRNYTLLEEAGVRIQGSYLDVYAVVEMDECFHPQHRMTRQESEQRRREALDILRSRGIIVSSEETTDCILPAMDLCHHSPYPTYSMGSNDGEAIGISVPLFNLVYHDCIVEPWASPSTRKGGWGLPGKDWGYLHALLNGGTTYYSPYMPEEDLARGRELMALHEKVATAEMVRHEFVDGDLRRQRTTFSDGTVVEVDFDRETYSIT